MQCFPVAQRDGGRDALYFRSSSRDFVIFQVKFVRNPWRDFDSKAWLQGIIEDELPKISALMPKGANAFYLLTNVPGTAFPDSGSIDQLNAAFKKTLLVDAFAWWRDDLDRRLDNAWNLKWMYQDLMRGPDIIRAVLESGNHEERERRSAAIRAFLRDEYDRETTVRFKQVELQNNLLELFVDVPLSTSGEFANRKQAQLYQHAIRVVPHSWRGATPPNDEIWREEDTPGAADFLLHQVSSKFFPRVVLQGAPGQGKSTIAQYLCQIHRMRLLDIQSDVTQAPRRHVDTPLRLPLKVDLRDLSAWLSRTDPFAADEDAPPPAHWAKSLESFLAAQIRHHSGGAQFSVEDLISVLKYSAVLLVFDGLDEVADINRRQEVVTEVVRGVHRLEENAASLQAIVTSRPAAFANSPGLPEEDFVHLHLDSLSIEQIQQYADKWVVAKRLQSRESSEVKRILKEKLDQPHIRDLSRNAMQLAILLSLIHRRGSSLPDKRTALYDNYIDLFFSRESEKSTTVREHRDLLIDLHRYVAWLLHTEAEKGEKQTGSIGVERLQRVLTEYLAREGHDTALVTELFHGMVERVIALVSRVQGTLEFEVQPLREYFAARYLYETAPYSPPGEEKRGTKPDRFDAIARNFYWLNVTRFYAGCFSKGELPSLVDRIQELSRDTHFKRLSHPRTLAGILLSDWVFSQHPRSVLEVLELVTDKIGLHFVLASPARRVGGGAPLVLPKRNGNDELVQKCFELLRSNPPRDFIYDVTDLIRTNATPSEIDRKWMDEETRFRGKSKTNWLDYGFQLGALGRLDAATASRLLEEPETYDAAIAFLFRARQFHVIESSDKHVDKVIERILGGSLRSPRQNVSILGHFAHAVEPWRYVPDPMIPGEMPLARSWEDPRHMPLKLVDFRPGSASLSSCAEFVKLAISLGQQKVENWRTKLEPWDDLVEFGRSIWGDTWHFAVMANFAAGIRSTDEQSADASELLDHRKSLCKRVRYARLRAGSPLWWSQQLRSCKSEYERRVCSLVSFTWASWGTLVKIRAELDAMLSSLSSPAWVELAHQVEFRFPWSEKKLSPDLAELEGMSARFVTLLTMRSKPPIAREILLQYLSDYSGNDSAILTYCSELVVDLLPVDQWSNHLELLSRSYLSGALSRSYAYQHAHRGTRGQLSIEAAKVITDSPHKFPGFLIGLAELRMRDLASFEIRPVGDIAIDEKWFEQDKKKKRARR